ncbi:polysaccharide transporter [Haloferax volcanii]|uniref:Polysaccharide transporter n=1 Tax=Haloferax volcanii TaxID=2246 RepID=A0A558FUV5_HALVO|nr:polysaccharide transporter [Haloferax volcanii]TVT89297.1 polysaccharide transporter [Haloferax volcanii]
MTRIVEDEVPGDDHDWRYYRKRPVVIQAAKVRQRVEVETREGTVVAEPGDYLLIGVEGEVYPCDADIFEKTYDRVVET